MALGRTVGALCATLLVALLPLTHPIGSPEHDLSRACIRSSSSAAVVDRVGAWLAQEVNQRLPSSRGGWQTAATCDRTAWQLELHLGVSNSSAFPPSQPCRALPTTPGSFLLTASKDKLHLHAIDAGGLQSGAGRLLRELYLPPRRTTTTTTNNSEPSTVTIPASLCVRHDAAKELWRIRGHQISVNSHPLQLRTEAAFTQFAKDLAVFGTNQLEMAHLGAVTTPSVLSGMVEFSKATAAVGINVSVWSVLYEK